MAKRILLLHLIILSAVTLYSQSNNVVINNIMEDYRQISPFFPSREGSVNENMIINRIRERLDALGVLYSTRNLAEVEEFHSFSKNIEVHIRGKREDTQILAVSLNSGFNNNVENQAINIALALGVIEYYSREMPPVSLTILFLGAEFGRGLEYPLGSNNFLKDFYPPYDMNLLYLQFEKIPSRILVQPGEQGVHAPKWAIESSADSMSEEGLYFLIQGNELQTNRMGYSSGGAKVIKPYLEREIPGILLSGMYGDEEDTPDTAEWLGNFISFFDRYIHTFEDGYPSEWDRHFLFFQIWSNYFIISENILLLIWVAVIVLGLLLILIFPQIVKSNLGRILIHFPQFVLMYFFVFLFLYVGTSVIKLTLNLRSVAGLWQEIPYVFFALKILILLLSYSFVFYILRRTPISEESDIIGAGSIFFVVINIILVTLVNISFSYYFLWAFFFLILFNILPQRMLKFAAVLAIPYWFIKILLDIFTIPQLDIANLLLFSDFEGNILLSTIAFPVVLSVVSLQFFKFKHHFKRNFIHNMIYTGVLSVITGTLLIITIVYEPNRLETGSPVFVTETIDYDSGFRWLDIYSRGLTGPMGLTIDDNSFLLEKKGEYIRYDLDEVPDLLTITKKETSFLDRNRIELTLDPENLIVVAHQMSAGQRPKVIKLLLSGSEDIIIFDSNFPYTLYPKQNTALIHIGVYPPDPLVLNITFPQGVAIEASIELQYDSFPHPFELEDRGEHPVKLDIREELFVRKTIGLQ